MTEALTRTQPAAIVVSDEDRETVRNTLCKGMTDSEMRLFVSFSIQRGFHPLSRTIVPYKDQKNDKIVTITTIDAFRTIAHRTGEYDGMDGPFWCGPDGKWLDVWLKPDRPAACKVVVYRRGCSHPFTAILLAREYQGKTVASSMPVHMLAKATEAIGLRRAFPEDLGQLFTDDEIPEAQRVTQAVDVTPPKPVSGRLSLATVTQQPVEVEAEVVPEAAPEPPAPYEFRPIEPEAPAYADPLDVLKAIKALQGVGVTSRDDLYSIFGGDPETLEIDVDHTPVSALDYAREQYRKRAPKKAKTA